jgi:hypothetical protein
MKSSHLVVSLVVIMLSGCGRSDSATKADSGEKARPTISQSKEKSGDSPHAGTASGPTICHFDITDAKDFKCGDSTGLKLHLILSGDMATNLSLHSNDIFVETKKGEKRSTWKFTQFFTGVKTKAQVEMTTLQIDNTFPMVQWLDDNAELIFELQPGARSEADLLFFGVDKSQVKSFHFGSIAPVTIK